MSDITNNMMMKLADAFYASVGFDGSCEYGAVGLNCKRPFGSSDADLDILEIVGAEPDEFGEFSERQMEMAREMYTKLPDFLRQQWIADRARDAK